MNDLKQKDMSYGPIDLFHAIPTIIVLQKFEFK